MDLVLEIPYWHPNGKSVAVRTAHTKHFVVWNDIHCSDSTIYHVTDNMDAETLSFLGSFLPGGDEKQIWEWGKSKTSPDERWRIDDLHATTLLREVQTNNYLRLALPHADDVLTTVDGEQYQSNHFRIRNLKSGSRLPDSYTSNSDIGASKYWNQSTAAFSGDGKTAVVRDPHILFWGEPVRKVPRTAAQLVNTRTGQPIGRPLQHPFDSVRAVAISPDGTIAATGGYHFGQSSGAAYV